MKKTSPLTAPIAIFIFTVAAAFSHVSPTQLLPTKLKVSVIDGNGNFVENAAVTLYLKEDDYINSKNPFQMQRTNEKGVAVFRKLDTKVYFIDARKGDQNNDGRGSRTDKLEKGKINKVNIVID